MTDSVMKISNKSDTKSHKSDITVHPAIRFLRSLPIRLVLPSPFIKLGLLIRNDLIYASQFQLP